MLYRTFGTCGYFSNFRLFSGVRKSGRHLRALAQGWPGCLVVVVRRASMAAVPIHAAAAVPGEYSLAFAAPGAPAAVNASDMKVEGESCHWFVSVASHELVASGLRYVVSYAQLNELMWCVAMSSES
mmetsp:Transcript_40339/g.100091  ORF Transcript_40339/g.100091 Transcript_40339/m.100091 type:complete len:127 (+) Transcript_40339:45-425(+)